MRQRVLEYVAVAIFLLVGANCFGVGLDAGGRHKTSRDPSAHAGDDLRFLRHLGIHMVKGKSGDQVIYRGSLLPNSRYLYPILREHFMKRHWKVISGAGGGATRLEAWNIVSPKNRFSYTQEADRSGHVELRGPLTSPLHRHHKRSND